MADLVVAGAGMAGLVAAAQARELGAKVAVHEKLDRPGGSMLLSSGYVWRHRRFRDFRAECPGGDERLQYLVFDRLDRDLDWLEHQGAPVLARETGNPRTVGLRFDTAAMTAALARAAGEVRLGDPLRELPGAIPPVVLATGGFPADRELLRRYVTPEADHLLMRCALGGTGDGLRLGLAAGARESAGLDHVYGRHMPVLTRGVPPGDFVGLAQRYLRHAEIRNQAGERCPGVRSWAEVDAFGWTARQPRARAWLRVPDAARDERVRELSVGEMVARAEAAGAPVRHENGATVVETVAGVTRTLGGLAIDERTQATPGVFAAGDDAGGIATGGYASGLAAALVLGRVAARAALGLDPGTGGD